MICMAMPSKPKERVSLRLFIVSIIMFVSTGVGLKSPVVYYILLEKVSRWGEINEY